MAETIHDAGNRVIRDDDGFVRCPRCGCKSFIPSSQWIKATVDPSRQGLLSAGGVKCLGCGWYAKIPADPRPYFDDDGEAEDE